MLTGSLVAALLAGCATTSMAAPENTQPLVTPEATFVVFQKAWRLGDVDTLLKIYAAGRLDGLIKQLQEQGREAVTQWYQRDAHAWEFKNPRWNREARWLAYLTVSLSPRTNTAPATNTTREVNISFAWVRGGWRITTMRTHEGP